MQHHDVVRFRHEPREGAPRQLADRAFERSIVPIRIGRHECHLALAEAGLLEELIEEPAHAGMTRPHACRMGSPSLAGSREVVRRGQPNHQWKRGNRISARASHCAGIV